MRYLVYLLLGLNIAYAIWYQTQPPQAPPASPVAPRAPDIEPLVLLSERNRGNLAATGPTVPPGETGKTGVTQPDSVLSMTDRREASAVAGVSPSCRTIGPIEERDEASVLRNQLSQQGYPATLREGEIEVPSGYQVYLPSMSSEKAGELVRDLEAAGMTDYFVGKRNRTSLGIFSSKDKAETRQYGVRKLGYDAVIDVRYKTRKVHWIDIEEMDRTPEPSEGWRRVMARYPRIKVRQVSCE